MTCIVEHHLHLLVQFHKLVIEYRFHEFKRIDCIVVCIERFHHCSAGTLVLSVFPFCFFLVYISAVLEHNIEKIRRSICTVYVSLEAALHKQRYPAAVIYVRMTEYHKIYFSRIEWKLFVIQSVLSLSSLELSAVQKYLVFFRSYKMA